MTLHVPGPSWCKWQRHIDAIYGWWLLCLSGNRPHNGCLQSTDHYFPSCWSWRTLTNSFLILFHCRIITQGWEEAVQTLQAFHRGLFAAVIKREEREECCNVLSEISFREQRDWYKCFCLFVSKNSCLFTYPVIFVCIVSNIYSQFCSALVSTNSRGPF